ncbi:ribosome maturation factor RimP [Jatrophihabitans sp. YIM 134969]
MPAPRGDDLKPLLEPVVAAAGYELDDVVVTPVGRRSLLRVTVDGDDGVDLDAIAVVSRAVADALDASDTRFGGETGAAYTLEVSSPGVDRPITEPRHWRRAKGRLVSTSTVADGTRFTGRVVDTSGASVVLEVDGTAREYPFDALGQGRVQVEFNRNGKPEDPRGKAEPDDDVDLEEDA